MVARSLSARLRRQLFQPFRDDDFRVLVTVEHAEFAAPFRFVSGDPAEFASLTSQGFVFTTFPFEITLLNDEEREPEATFRIQNADDRIGSTILALPSESVSLMLQVVMRETPDVIEYEAANLELVDVEVTALFVSGKIVVRGFANEPCPGRVLTKRMSPVFFR